MDTCHMGHTHVRSDLELYLDEISRIPLLTAEEEKVLAWGVLNDECHECKRNMIQANLRLVVSIAKQNLRTGMALQDLINEGNIGLIRAVERFDPALGNRFSTYATWWIRKTIKQAVIEFGQHLHVPSYMRQRMAAWDRTVRELEIQLDRSPTAEELADAMNVPRSKLRIIQRTMAMTKSIPTGSASEEVGSVREIDMQADDLFESGPTIAERCEDMQKMRKLISAFDPMAARVIRMRFGLDGRTPLTLKEAGLEVGLTRERVRQIEQAALERLREAFRDRAAMQVVSQSLKDQRKQAS